MKVKDVMTAGCQYVLRDEPVRKAARMMADSDFGVTPVADGDKLVGMLTDRDIVTRGVAEGRDLDHVKAGELMSAEVYYCFDDEDCGKAAANMGEMQVRRMPVVDREKRLVGMLSLGDLATRGERAPAAAALSEISQKT